MLIRDSGNAGSRLDIAARLRNPRHQTQALLYWSWLNWIKTGAQLGNSTSRIVFYGAKYGFRLAVVPADEDAGQGPYTQALLLPG